MLSENSVDPEAALLKEDRVRHLGWMRAATAIRLLQGIVLQVLVYGTESFIDMT